MNKDIIKKMATVGLASMMLSCTDDRRSGVQSRLKQDSFSLPLDGEAYSLYCMRNDDSSGLHYKISPADPFEPSPSYGVNFSLPPDSLKFEVTAGWYKSDSGDYMVFGEPVYHPLDPINCTLAEKESFLNVVRPVIETVLEYESGRDAIK